MKQEKKTHKARVILTDAVATASYAMSLGKMSKDQARSHEEGAVKKAIRTFGLKTVILSIASYKRALHNIVKDGKIEIVKTKDGKQTRELVPIYTYGVDQFLRSRYPDHWKRITQDERKSRPKDGKK